MRGTPTIEEVLRMAMEARLADVHVALPGKVVAYDASTHRADIQPMVTRLVPTPEEDNISEELPVIPAVPVMVFGGGGFSLHIPLAVGDGVLLVFCERDPSEWHRTGEVSDPADQRLHNLAHAVAIPGFRRLSQVLGGTHPSNMTLHSKVDGTGFVVTFTTGDVQFGGDSDSLARTSKMVAELADIKKALETAVAPAGGGAVTYGDPYTGPAGDIGTTRVKVSD